VTIDFGAHVDVALIASVLGRVVKQIGHHLDQPRLIAQDSSLLPRRQHIQFLPAKCQPFSLLSRFFHSTSAWVLVKEVFGLALLCIAAAGIWGCLAVFWTLTSDFLTGAAAAVGIATINTTGQVGGLLGPWGVGVIKDLTGNFSAALVALAVAAFLAALIAFLMPDRPSNAADTDNLQANPVQ
jgi:nitrate/nitrite transporter NarK